MVLGILSPYENAYSETFIQAHRSLPFENYFFCRGVGYLPTKIAGTPKLARLIRRMYFTVKSLVNRKLSTNEQVLQSLLREKKVDCVLAEYGVTAAASFEVLQSLHLPLIVHFHGFDASDKAVLEKYSEKYKKVFKYARFVVTVSKKMFAD